jgi:hypothetical protein
LAGNEAKTFVAAEFLAFGKQQLKPQANTHKRLAGRDELLDRLDQVQRFQVVHGVSERPNARQYRGLRFFDNVFIRRDDGVDADCLKRVPNAV